MADLNPNTSEFMTRDQVEAIVDEKLEGAIDSIVAAVSAELGKNGGVSQESSRTVDDSTEKAIAAIRQEYRENKTGLQRMNVTEEMYVESTCTSEGIDYAEFKADKAAA